jgi:spermidine synthase
MQTIYAGIIVHVSTPLQVCADPRNGVCASQVFAGGSVCYAYTTIPTYPSGQIGMMVCCKGQQLDVRQPRQPAPGPLTDLSIPPLR